MKRMIFCIVLAVLLTGIAFADPIELIVESGGSSTPTLVGSDGSVIYSNNNFAGWKITVVAGASNSPSLTPYGIDLSSLSAECYAASCAELDVYLSDTGFTQVVTGLTQTDSGTLTGSASTTQQAWVDQNNNDFGMTTSLGSVGPLAGSGFAGGSITTFVNEGPSPYSLTLEDTFAGCTSQGCASYSTDGNITAVPEPASIALFGAGLLGIAGFARRRFLNR